MSDITIRKTYATPRLIEWIAQSQPFQTLLIRLRPCGFEVDRYYESLAACIERGWSFLQVEQELERRSKPLSYPGDELAGRQLARISYDQAAKDYIDHFRGNRRRAAVEKGFDPNADEGGDGLPRHHW